MSLPGVAAAVFAILAAFPILGQLAPVLGAPWASITLGGRWPGVLPPRLRLAALAQAAILFTLAVIALDHGGLLRIGLPTAAIWITVAVSCVSAVLNNITPSRIERRLWGGGDDPEGPRRPHPRLHLSLELPATCPQPAGTTTKVPR
jgi:hypothetical protein